MTEAPQPVPSVSDNHVFADGTIDALAILSEILPHMPACIQRRLEHARTYLSNSLEAHLFGGPSRATESEQQSQAALKILALELHAAGRALDSVAEALKLQPCGKHDKLTLPVKRAAERCHSQADDWVSR